MQRSVIERALRLTAIRKITKQQLADSFGRLHYDRAKPASEMQRSVIERALRLTAMLASNHLARCSQE